MLFSKANSGTDLDVRDSLNVGTALVHKPCKFVKTAASFYTFGRSKLHRNNWQDQTLLQIADMGNASKVNRKCCRLNLSPHAASAESGTGDSYDCQGCTTLRRLAYSLTSLCGLMPGHSFIRAVAGTTSVPRMRDSAPVLVIAKRA
eukprot:1275226-Amphidinium_carterae.1